MIERQHHPSCASRFGGLCTNCPPVDRPHAATAGSVPLSCVACGEEYVAIGSTDEARDRAVRDCPGCCGEVGTGAGEGAPGQDTGSAWVTRSADCPEAPAQAHLPAPKTTSTEGRPGRSGETAAEVTAGGGNVPRQPDAGGGL